MEGAPVPTHPGLKDHVQSRHHPGHSAHHQHRCRFKLGVNWHRSPAAAAVLQEADYLTIWLGPPSERRGARFNKYWHGSMLDYARTHNRTVVYYAYIVAGLARHIAGLRDCDMSDSPSTSLCVHGADFIRQHAPQILELYSHYANETASRLGRSSDTVWLIEPDWYQYSQEGQQGGGLTQDAMVSLYGRISDSIRSHLPRARLSVDVSPWATDQDAWLTPFLRNVRVRRSPPVRPLVALPQRATASGRLHTLSPATLSRCHADQLSAHLRRPVRGQLLLCSAGSAQSIDVARIAAHWCRPRDHRRYGVRSGGASSGERGLVGCGQPEPARRGGRGRAEHRSRGQ
jgi:hypothetical protein